MRRRVMYLLGGSYLAYWVLAWALKLPLDILGYRQMLLVLASLIWLLLTYLGAFRNRWIKVTVAGIAGLWLLYSAANMLHVVERPTVLLMWSIIITLVFDVLLGSLLGAVFSVLLVGGLGILLLLDAPGQYAVQWFTGLVVLATTAGIGYLVMQFIERNINLHEQASDELKAARLDALTGVYGRAATEAELRRAVSHALKSSTPLSIIVTDIDHFKKVNDQHGHGAGDDVLRSFAKRLRRIVGSSGMVGRWGGEEFLIILPAVARPDAIAQAEHLRREVSDSPIAGLDVTASFGVASFRGHGEDQDQLFGRADQRLYDAKNAGRNAVRG